MIDTIIFDIGNVLADFTWRELIDAQGYSTEDKETAMRLFTSPHWKEVDRGVLSDDEILDKVCGGDPAARAIMEPLYIKAADCIKPNDYSQRLIEEIKARGLRLYVLSNFGAMYFEHCRAYYSFLALMDGAVVSYQEKIIKPDPRIYQILIDRYKIDPLKAVYLDDHAKNLAPAAALGMETIHVTGFDSIIEGLNTIGAGLPAERSYYTA